MSSTRLARLSLAAAVLASAFAFHGSPLRAGGEGWMTDYAAALALAKKEKKDVLIDFTGSDWCGWCIRLNKEVFSQASFKKEAPKNFVLVELDFPRRTQLSAKLKAQNAKLQREFEVQVFPSIWLVDSQGRPYAKSGYRAGGAASYLKHLSALRSTRVKRDEHFEKAKKTKGVEKARHLSRGLDQLNQLDSGLAMKKYSKVIDEILELDADDKAGLKSKYGLVREIARIGKDMRTATPDEILPRIDKALTKSGDKGPEAQQLYLMKAQVTYEKTQSNEDAVKWLEKAVAADPNTAMARNLKQTITQLKGA